MRHSLSFNMTPVRRMWNGITNAQLCGHVSQNVFGAFAEFRRLKKQGGFSMNRFTRRAHFFLNNRYASSGMLAGKIHDTPARSGIASKGGAVHKANGGGRTVAAREVTRLKGRTFDAFPLMRSIGGGR